MMGIGRTPWNFDIVSYTQTGSPNECFPGLVNFVPAAAYHFCFNLPRAFSQPGKYSFGDPCTQCAGVWRGTHFLCVLAACLPWKGHGANRAVVGLSCWARRNSTMQQQMRPTVALINEATYLIT